MKSPVSSCWIATTLNPTQIYFRFISGYILCQFYFPVKALIYAYTILTKKFRGLYNFAVNTLREAMKVL